MAYNGFLPENVINIGKIYSIHYFEYMSDFSFEGESHDFWEFICVDKGEVEVTGGDKKFILHKGEIAFHEPMIHIFRICRLNSHLTFSAHSK